MQVVKRACISIFREPLVTMSLDKKSEPFTENVFAVQEDPGDLLKGENRKAAERRVVRKLDMRLMPTVAIIYLMNYIDVSWSIVTWATLFTDRCASRGYASV